MSKQPLVSVIVPTYNSADHIEACLGSINSQSYPELEIILTDQGSQDQTISIAQNQGAQIIHLPRPAFYSPPTKSRNIGAKASKGDYLIHLDSDMELSPGLIWEVVAVFNKDPEIGALVMHEQDCTKGFWSQCKALERKCYWGNDKIESARVVRRVIFDKVGGYDEGINAGEDFDIHRRYKKVCIVAFLSRTVAHNLGNLSFRKSIRKKYNYGKTAAAYFDKHGESGSSVLREQLRCFTKNRMLFIRSPLYGAGTVLLKISEFGAGFLGLAVGKISFVIAQQRIV